MSSLTRVFGWLALLVGLLGMSADTFAQAGGIPVADKNAIKGTLNRYRDAIKAADGELVYKLLDSKTIQWYDDALKDALSLKKADLEKRDYLEKLTVLRLRHEFLRADLEKKTGKEVIVDGVKKGWIGGSFADMIVIQFMDKDKDKDGMVFVTLRQAPKVPAFYFASEDGKWKLALSHTFRLANKGFEQLQAKSSLSTEDFLAKMLEDATRKKVDKSIFDGPREKDAKPEEKK